MISNNDPQFASSEFIKFSKEEDFEHRTSSPGNSKGNRIVELAVKTAENLTWKALDATTHLYLAILNYHNTPTQGIESSSVQRLMNRRTQILLPTTKLPFSPEHHNETEKSRTWQCSSPSTTTNLHVTYPALKKVRSCNQNLSNWEVGCERKASHCKTR